MESELNAFFLGSSPYPKRGVDAAGESVQNVDIFMLVQEDEAEEDLQKCWFRDASQEKVQVCSCGHDLLHRHLEPMAVSTESHLPEPARDSPQHPPPQHRDTAMKTLSA